MKTFKSILQGSFCTDLTQIETTPNDEMSDIGEDAVSVSMTTFPVSFHFKDEDISVA